MKYMNLSSLSVKNIKKILTKVWKRFPVSVGLIAAISIIFLTLIHGNFEDTLTESLVRGVLSLILAFFLSLGVYLLSESQKVVSKHEDLLQFLPLIFGGLFYITFSASMDNFENVIFFILTLFGIISFLFVAPYTKKILTKKGKQSVYYTYFFKISVVFLISFILGGILFGLGAIGIAAVFSLFDLHGILDDKIYGDWAVIAMSIFTPIFALTQLPSKESFKSDKFHENAFFSFLVKYVAVPFIFIYFIILYAYSIKVLLNFGDWPKGEVSWLVIGFSVFGYITYIFSYIFEKKLHIVALFRKYFPYVVIPQLCMLFYAIYLRIAQYDITINRYFVVVFGLWLLVVSLYLIVSKKKYLANIPAILTLFTIIISIGPWSVYHFPESRQIKRLENKLVDANILQDGIIVPLTSKNDIDAQLSGEIYDGIDYLCDFSECKRIKKLFPEQYADLEEKSREQFHKNNASALESHKGNDEMIAKINNRVYNGPHKWEIVSEITRAIKVEPFYSYNQSSRERYIYYHLDHRNSLFPIELGEYSQMLELNSYTDRFTKIHGKVDLKRKLIEVRDGTGKVLDTMEAQHVFTSILENPAGQLQADDLTFELSGDVYTAKIFLNSINIPDTDDNMDNTNNYTGNADGFMLIKQ